MNESAGEVRDLVLTSDFFLPAPFCLLALLLPPLPLGAPMSTAESVKQAYNLALHMQTQTSTLLQTYVSDGAWAGGEGRRLSPSWPSPGEGSRTRLEEGSSMAPGLQGLCQLEARPQEWGHSWLAHLGQVIPSLSVLASSSAKWDADVLADLSGLSEDSKETPRESALQAHESVHDHLCPCFCEPMPWWEIQPHYLTGSSDSSRRQNYDPFLQMRELRWLF